ncbi:uncharacterized protein M421DRAFT_91623 [Didymella exigua CBS 183.55]|uniref:Uncharacterized protein n=1 Tax=Didymella exigua CBS 183.55 TaxID=1150837 RepID=A0A6A5RN39_9PLEO|nr:uncharacterized protein M421DRAFT_91623 [Didymella exigua CBS 183.55]KAF1929841.1 hypothetical protein M421DRAFT_91623 [Didymella exigua CBS 183.55]
MTDEPQQGYAQESAPLQSQRSAVSTTTLSISEDDVEEATYIQTPQRVSIPEGTPATPLLQADKVTATPERWPTSQQKVLKSKFEISWDGFFDFALFISAVAFLAFAAFNDTRHSSLVIRTRRTYCGSGYTSSKHIINNFGLALVAVWALSSTGGQASLRQMAIGTKNETSDIEFGYMNYHGYTNEFQTKANVFTWGVTNSMFVSAMIGSVAPKSSQVDIEGWFATTGGGSDSYERYTSMVGIPVRIGARIGRDVSKPTDYITRIQTPYFNMKCEVSKSGKYLWPTVPQGMVNFTGPGAVAMFENITQLRRSRVDPKTLAHFQFQYLTRDWKMNNHRLECNVSNSYVETEAVCQYSTSCVPTNVRRYQLDLLPQNLTMMELSWRTPRVLFEQMLESVTAKSGWPSILDRYLDNPRSHLEEAADPAVAELNTSDNYSVRMAHLMNSYFTILNGLYAITAGLTAHKQPIMTDLWNATFIPSLNSAGPNMELQNTNDFFIDDRAWFQRRRPSLRGIFWPARGTERNSTEVVVAHKPWVVTLCIASIALIFSSLLSPLIHYIVIEGPEIMMNISSLATRNNSYIQLPEGGTHLNVATSARLLKDVEVPRITVQPASGLTALPRTARSTFESDFASPAIASRRCQRNVLRLLNMPASAADAMIFDSG